jgi:predicted DNA-binding transcriptional regulator YafY
MNRIDRLVAILIHLQSKKVVTASEIAERFSMSVRTVYRDIRALEEAGVPLGAEAGKGYYILQGYHLPPVMFSRDEAAAMLTAGKMVEKLTDNSLVSHYQSAMFKIKSVLRPDEKEYLNNLDSHIVVFQPSPFLKNEFPNNYQVDIHQAIINKQVVEIEYFASSSNEYTRRVIEPIGLCYYSSRWHLIAYCRLRKEYRDFRVDKIKEIKKTDEKFKSDHLSLHDYFLTSRNTEEFLTVEVLFAKEIAADLYEQRYYFGFINEFDEGDYVRMVFLTNSFDWIGRWLMGFGNKVKIISPNALIDYIRRNVVELNNHYKL